MSESRKCPYDPSARQMAHQLRRSGMAVDLSGSEAELKPAAAAHFSDIIAKVVSVATTQYPRADKHPFTRSPWERLRMDMAARLSDVAWDVLRDSSTSVALGALYDIQRQRQKHNRIIYADPHRSVEGGAGTAASVGIPLLEDIYKKAQALNVTGTSTDKLRNSHRPFFDVVNGNSTQLVALTNEVFITHRLPDVMQTEHSFDYVNPLMDLPLTRTTRRAILMTSEPQPDALTIGELVDTKSPTTVGCPIILNPKDVVDLWQYTIGAAEDRGLVA